MRIALLGSASSWYTEDLRRAAGRRHSIQSISYRQLASEVSTSGIAHTSAEYDLHEFDAVLVRSMPPGSLEQIVFRMDALGNLAAAGKRIVNSPRAIEVAVDKYLASVRLQQAGLHVPKTIVCQTVEQAMQSWEHLGGNVVVKPLFGSEGRGIVRIDDEAIALRTFKALEQVGAVLYLQQFIEHEGCDLRLLVVGEQVLGMQRRHPLDWRTNIARGATAEPLEVTEHLASKAKSAAQAVGATIAGVDLLSGKDGHLYALEVNAVPGWRALAEVTGTDVAGLVLDHLGAQ